MNHLCDAKLRVKRGPRAARLRKGRGFTLMEVMIAMAIFFMAVFAILELVAGNLRNARMLETPRVDAGLVIADTYQTNQLEEGARDIGDFGKVFPGYACREEMVSVGTNGLFHVQYLLTHPDGTVETNLSALLWKPDSKPVLP